MNQLIGNVFILGSVQGFLLTILLFVKKQNKQANRILSVAILCLSLDLLAAYLFSIKFYIEHPATFGATAAFPFIYGPIFYLYTLILSGEKKKFKAVYLLHFLPFLLFHLYLSPYYFLSDADKLRKINEYLSVIQPDLLVISLMKPLHGFIYTLFSLKVLSHLYIRMKESYSNIDTLKFNWLRYLLSGTIIVWCVAAASILSEAFAYSESPVLQELIYIFIAVLVYAIGYGALNQPEVFNLAGPAKEEPVSDTAVIKEKYEKSSLREGDIEKIKTDLLLLMKNKKPYLNGNLTLAQLAGELNISPHNLSESINKMFNKNFYDFINTYRIEEFKERLKDPEFSGYSIIAIAFESGFSSKSSFNTIFKKHTQLTPSEFRKKIS